MFSFFFCSTGAKPCCFYLSAFKLLILLLFILFNGGFWLLYEYFYLIDLRSERLLLRFLVVFSLKAPKLYFVFLILGPDIFDKFETDPFFFLSSLTNILILLFSRRISYPRELLVPSGKIIIFYFKIKCLIFQIPSSSSILDLFSIC